MVKNKKIQIPLSSGINQIDLKSPQLDDYRATIINLIETNNQNLQIITFFKRYKHRFVTYHTMLYDKPFKCCSFIISYMDDQNKNYICYGNIIVFYCFNNRYFALIQRYRTSTKRISYYADLPTEILQKLDALYPLLELSNDYDIISVGSIRHKCVAIRFKGVFCLSEIRADFEHD